MLKSIITEWTDDVGALPKTYKQSVGGEKTTSD